MKYVFYENGISLKDTICQINNVELSSLDVSDFKVDDLKILNDFKDHLLSLKDKRFFIVGDYDCDGICATAIMKRLFDDLNIASNYYIPSRAKEGYGLNMRIVDTAADHGFDVLLCVDNGIIANEQLRHARERGLHTLVIDHHEYQDDPDCDAFLHPNLFDEKYADMCAAGLCALLSSSIREDDLTLVYGGLATLADMVRVLGYNRYLLNTMLSILKSKDIYPISYLMKSKDYDYETLSFEVIPKINAVSRMDDSLNVNYVVRYLLSERRDCAMYLPKIEEINASRKQLSKQMAVLAKRLCDVKENVVVVASDAFKEGLCGLIANRLMDELGKPVLVLSKSDHLLKGSGRCPKGGDLHGYLMGVSSLFSAFGGHAQAVGLSIEEEKYEEFLQYIKEHDFEISEVSKDVIALDQNEYTNALLEELNELKPFGQGFEEPLFAIKDCNYSKRFLISASYPKFVLSEDLEAISFNTAHAARKFTTMIGHVKKDNYHPGKLSFVIEDLI